MADIIDEPGPSAYTHFSTKHEIIGLVAARMAAIEDAFAVAAERWLVASGNDPSSARDTARATLTFCQGYIAQPLCWDNRT